MTLQFADARIIKEKKKKTYWGLKNIIESKDNSSLSQTGEDAAKKKKLGFRWGAITLHQNTQTEGNNSKAIILLSQQKLTRF